MRYLPIVLLLAGCASSPPGTFPRVLWLDAIMPSCVLLCQATVSVIDNESENLKAEKGNTSTVTINRTSTITEATNDSLSVPAKEKQQ